MQPLLLPHATLTLLLSAWQLPGFTPAEQAKRREVLLQGWAGGGSRAEDEQVGWMVAAGLSYLGESLGPVSSRSRHGK